MKTAENEALTARNVESLMNGLASASFGAGGAAHIAISVELHQRILRFLNGLLDRHDARKRAAEESDERSADEKAADEQAARRSLLELHVALMETERMKNLQEAVDRHGDPERLKDLSDKAFRSWEVMTRRYWNEIVGRSLAGARRPS